MPDDKSLRLHLKTVHQRREDTIKYLCGNTNCQKTWKTARAAATHRRACKADETPEALPVPCDECPRTFATLAGKQLHRKTAHPAEYFYSVKTLLF